MTDEKISVKLTVLASLLIGTAVGTFVYGLGVLWLGSFIGYVLGILIAQIVAMHTMLRLLNAHKGERKE